MSKHILEAAAGLTGDGAIDIRSFCPGAAFRDREELEE